jgi:DNA-binding Lrp family transcriptional regulator
MAEAQRIDDLDRSIIDRLKRDASATNRALAEALGVTEQTIAVRIRRLEDANLLRVVGLLDARAVGYGLFVIVGIQVAGRPPVEVAAEVAAFPFVTGVTSCLGGFELTASLYARDERDLFDVLERRIGAIRGVEELESFLVLERVHHRTDWATIDRLGRLELPEGGSDLIDELDREILVHLQEDARTSLREVGRRLARSEGTIRARVRRLEESGLCRIQAVADVSIGPGGSSAWLALKARRGAVRRVAEEIARAPETGFVGITLGRFDVLAMVSAPGREELSRLMFERVALIPGVQRLEAWESLTVHKHDFRVADLSVASEGPRGARASRGTRAHARGARSLRTGARGA